MIDINGRLHSTEKNVNVIAGADEILDDSKNKKQSEINTETYALVNDVNERLSGLSPDQQSALSVAAKATNNEIKLGYYVCGTEGNVAAKIISDATGYVLSTGGSIKVKMTNVNTANNATLNINSTGVKPLYYDGERASANNTWEAGETVEVYYDGTNFYANNVAGGGGDGVFDVSEKYPTSGVEGGNTYTLDGALAVLNANLPTSKKKGGMSIKFVQTYDNKYVQYRLMSQTFSNDVANWQGVDDEPTAGSSNLVKSGGVYVHINNINKDLNGFEEPWPTYERANIYRTSAGKWGASTGDFKIIMIPVSIGDVIVSTWIDNTRRYLVARKPVIGDTVDNILPENTSSVTPETITSSIDGYFVISYITNNVDFTPSALTINGIDQFSSKIGINEKVDGFDITEDPDHLFSITDKNSHLLFGVDKEGKFEFSDISPKACTTLIDSLHSDINGLVTDKFKSEQLDRNGGFMRIVNYQLHRTGLTFQMLKSVIDTMYGVGLNILQYPIVNVVLDDMTFNANGQVYDFSSIFIPEQLSKNEFSQLVNYARDRGIEFICTIDGVLTHANNFLNLFPQFIYQSDNTDGLKELDFRNEAAVNAGIAYTEKYAELAESLGCKYVHLGCDEFNYPSGYKALRDADEYGYAYYINKLSYMLRKHNITSIIWNDPVCVENSTIPRIDKNIIVDYWADNYSNPGDHNPSDAIFVNKHGYRLINSNQSLYWTFASSGPKVTPEKIAQFQVTNFSGSYHIKDVIGCVMNVWGDGATSSDVPSILTSTLPLIEAYGNRLNEIL